MKALEFYEKSCEIQQKVLPAEHPDLAVIYDNIGGVYEVMEEHAKALSFYERAVKIAEQALPEKHSRIRKYRNHLDDLQKKL
jgi:tetratricopeptide (TPR) repeat protein